MSEKVSFSVIIAGTREFINGRDTGIRYGHVKIAVELSGWKDKITHVVSGMASTGADYFGAMWAKEMSEIRKVNGFVHKTGMSAQIPLIMIPARWEELGKSAGMERNGRMAEVADALIAVWDGESKGTENMIECMKKEMKPIVIYNFKTEEMEYSW